MSEENLYTFENETYRKTYWHTCSHVLETTKNIRLKLCNQPNLFPPGQPSLDFPRR